MPPFAKDVRAHMESGRELAEKEVVKPRLPYE
jgi:hypothetical protein